MSDMHTPGNPRRRFLFSPRLLIAVGLLVCLYGVGCARIDDVQPNPAPAGTEITITGAGFGAAQGANSVLYDNAAMPVVSWADTSIVATLPSPKPTGTYTVSVVVNGSPVTHPHTIGESPIVTGIDPNPAVPGAEVTITGSAFGASQSTSEVVYDGSSLAVTAWSDTVIVARLPAAQRVGTFDLQVVRGPATGSAPLSILCTPPSCVHSEVPAEGGTVSLPGFGDVTFPAGAVPAGQPVRVEATQTPETEGDYQALAGFMAAGARAPNEIRINTDEGAPTGPVTVTVTVPASMLPPPAGTSILPVIEVDDISPDEVQSHMVALDATLSGDQLTFTLPPEAFTQAPSSDATWEAIVILAPFETTPQAATAPGAATTPLACAPGGSWDQRQVPPIWDPLPGIPAVTSAFNPTSDHHGVDFRAGDGTVITSADYGIVVSTPGDSGNPHKRPCKKQKDGRWEQRCDAPPRGVGLCLPGRECVRGYGNFVLIKHDQGAPGTPVRYTYYGHLQDGGVQVATGQRVAQYQAIALSGHTGGVTGPHLHMEYKAGPTKDSQQFDPVPCMPLTGSTADMVLVPPGEFTMGANYSDLYCGPCASPVHTVYLDRFWIDRTEVTVDAYAACVAEGGCTAPVPFSIYNPDDPENYNNGCNWGAPWSPGGHPVNCVDWYQSAAYCAWAGKHLPTEAQWEKAARGTDARTYPWGEALPSCDYAVMEGADGLSGCGLKHTWPVGSKPVGASPYGALDMTGNLWEWVNDWSNNYADYLVFANPPGPPWGGNSSKSIRGGSWNHYRNYPGYLRAWYRMENEPSDPYAAGFRCALDGG